VETFGGGAEVFGDTQDGVKFAVEQQSRKLLPSDAAEDVGGADVACETGGDLAEDGIAGAVAESVVDALDVIEVDEEDREGAGAGLAVGDAICAAGGAAPVAAERAGEILPGWSAGPRGAGRTASRGRVRRRRRGHAGRGRGTHRAGRGRDQ